MKKYIHVMLSLALILIGMIGIIVCIVPSASAEYRLVKKYISAVNKADYTGMQECCANDKDLINLFNFDSVASDDTQEDSVTDRATALKASRLGIGAYLPEDAKEVASLKVIGCSEAPLSETDSFSSASAVTAIIQMTYIDADGETAIVSHQENFVIAKTADGLKMM